MVRTFLDGSVQPEVVHRILDHGRRGPSAGYAQGFAFLVFDGPEETGRFWGAASAGGDHEWILESVRRAPVVIVPLASKQAYLDRYAEEDKGWTDQDEARWPTPFWLVDAAFASMLMLLTAVDEGLGALFFGLYPPAIPSFKVAFGVPEEWEPIGAIAVGHPAPVDPVRSSRDTRRRKSLQEVVHRGRW
jgi:nitroreductase